jgi:hypothetical protein
MAKQKRVRCFGHGPLNLGPHYTVGWEDVWLRWVSKPGKTIHRAGPCLMSRGDALGSLEEAKWTLTQDDLMVKYGDIYREDLEDCQAIVDRLNTERFVLDDHHASNDPMMPNIYTQADDIDRAEAERMLAWWLERVCGVTRPKFQWKRVEGPIIFPF